MTRGRRVRARRPWASRSARRAISPAKRRGHCRLDPRSKPGLRAVRSHCPRACGRPAQTVRPSATARDAPSSVWRRSARRRAPRQAARRPGLGVECCDQIGGGNRRRVTELQPVRPGRGYVVASWGGLPYTANARVARKGRADPPGRRTSHPDPKDIRPYVRVAHRLRRTAPSSSWPASATATPPRRGRRRRSFRKS